MRIVLIGLLAAILAACESSPPAPTIDRAPQASKPAPPKNATKAANKDWRPDSYIVKKGDTLFSIGLEYGYDYKDIAAANNIAAPYPIKIGQKLSFSSLNSKVAPATEAKSAETRPVNIENDDGVIISPIKTDTGATATPAGTPIITGNAAVIPVLSEPKAIREPYSLEALNRKTIIAKTPETQPTDIKLGDSKPLDAKPADTKPVDNKPADDENLVWVWPTQGKVSATFNEVSNKGIDITGSMGQSVNAAAAGKVIYVGADLRGYGKLVIIKHNKTFLSVYAHNSKIITKEGQTVTAGQKIAEMGNTDSSTVNLHFEIRRQGKSADPAKYLPQN